MFEIILLTIAAFAAGALNAVAGGGTFITLPALIWVGAPPVVANATATLAVLPGYISSAWAFRRDMRAEGALGLTSLILIAAVGGLLGAGLLIVTPGEAFLWVVPWLLLIATALFAAGPWLTAKLNALGAAGAGPVASAAAIFAVSVYGGYFNGGLGIMLLAVFGVIGFSNLHGMNGLKNALSALLSLVSVIAFALADIIAWEYAPLMALSATCGGYVGARLSRRIVRTDILRVFVSLVGAGMTVAFFAQ